MSENKEHVKPEKYFTSAFLVNLFRPKIVGTTGFLLFLSVIYLGTILQSEFQ